MRVETSPLRLLHPHFFFHFTSQAVMSCRFPGQLTLSEQVGFTVWHFAQEHGCWGLSLSNSRPLWHPLFWCQTNTSWPKRTTVICEEMHQRCCWLLYRAGTVRMSGSLQKVGLFNTMFCCDTGLKNIDACERLVWKRVWKGRHWKNTIVLVQKLSRNQNNLDY